MNGLRTNQESPNDQVSDAGTFPISVAQTRWDEKAGLPRDAIRSQ